ncbi:MAG: hypothetical protein ABUT20_18770, partial [Bacteroidota bacterium]
GPALVNGQNVSSKNISINKTDDANISKADPSLPPATHENAINDKQQEKKVIDSRIQQSQFPVPDQSGNRDILVSKKSNSDKIISKAINDLDIVPGKPASALINKNNDNTNSATVRIPGADISTKIETSGKTEQANSIDENKISLQKPEQPEASNELKGESSQKIDSNLMRITSDVKKKTQAAKRNSFFVSLSAVPDVSAAGKDNAGKLQLGIGAGIGYTFHDKLTLRTGFYTSRKVYSASPDEYHPPAAFWTYYPDLEKVDADCKVYEIPLLLSYNFGNSIKHKWIGTAGLSSYLMKEEIYNYTYKNAVGQYRYTSKTFYDQNKHYFSVLTLSAGYQRQIDNTIFFAVEPYMKIPLAGVGYGKVKLNSLGVQLSIAAKLFNASKKQSH